MRSQKEGGAKIREVLKFGEGAKIRGVAKFGWGVTIGEGATIRGNTVY